ncbi:MAG: DUF1643 domain-containing protein [Nanoarchaeota archaeon]|nr:DUF1643 domain-containing protein [Nanoarchaeota archaeon]
MNPTEILTITSEANLSECGNYRYWLSRIWDKTKPIGAFVCLNPSKATSVMCDTTLCNCNNLAAQWGWGGFYIVNLFAYMATDPNDMNSQENPIGELNNQAIKHICDQVSMTVLAWGNGYNSRSQEVINLLEGKKLYCIAKNKGGGFLHPSRIKPENYPKAKAI